MFFRQCFLILLLFSIKFSLTVDNNKSIDIRKIWCKNICVNNCNCTNDFQKFVISKIFKFQPPKVLCVEEHFLNLYWNTQGNYHYLLEIRNGNRTQFTHLTKKHYLTVYPLIDNTFYRIRLWAKIINQNTLIKSDFINITTAESNTNPLPVKQLSVKQLILNNRNKYDALITWTPADDLACYYDLVWFSDNSDDHYVAEELNWMNLNEYKIDGLNFNQNYSMSITARRTNRQQESTATWLHFQTPSCLDTFKTLKKCAPEMPENLTLTEQFENDSFMFNVIAEWSTPKYLPNYYILYLISLIPRNNLTNTSLKITGDQTRAKFLGIHNTVYYQVLITAWSSGGSSPTALATRHITKTQIVSTNPDLINQNRIFLIFVLSTGVLTIGIVCLVVFLILRRIFSKKKPRINPDPIDNYDIIKFSNGDTDDHYEDPWEIDPNHLQLLDILGEGEFGLVKRGLLTIKNQRVNVAVKMLKSSTTITKPLNHEIEIMKTVGYHPHLLSMIGYISKEHPNEPLLIVEYCSGGNLQDYLRLLSNDRGQYPNTASRHYPSTSSNPSYFNRSMIESKDLLSFARQISIGMEYLSNMKIIHRDLAARNILVCANKIVKISDFGLSRDLYKNDYYKTSGGRLPLKWMALESLITNTFTTESDVWSFGILLWEIVTLGQSPYAGMTLHNILVRLSEGYRLDKPSNCNIVLYDIMHDCWDALSKNRPTFSELKNRLEFLLEDASNYLQLHIYEIENHNNNDVISEDYDDVEADEANQTYL